jgi:hypothetical protein
LSPAQYEKHLRLEVALTLDAVDRLYPLPKKERLLRQAAAQSMIRIGLFTLDKVFTESDTLDWAEGFWFKDSKATEGECLLDETGGDLAVLGRKRFDKLPAGHINTEQISEFPSLRPKYVLKLTTVKSCCTTCS